MGLLEPQTTRAMGRAFPTISAKVCIRALERADFRVVAQKGSHVKLRSEETGRRCVVPMHPELATGTLASIIRQAGLSPDEFFHHVDPRAFPLPASPLDDG
jgi:predicted RNA binding protein YcfA (HicA-like mRNA interferase family)